jgi:hypothetical protein
MEKSNILQFHLILYMYVTALVNWATSVYVRDCASQLGNLALINVKMFQQDDTFCTVFYSLQTSLHVSSETFTHHQELE